MSRSIIFDDFVQGANDRLSPRILSHYIRPGGTYGGPYPRMHNVDRIAGTLRPRGGECKINGVDLPGAVLGILAVKPFTGDPMYPAADYPEVLIVVCDGGTRGPFATDYSVFGRIIPNHACPAFEELGTLDGDGPAQFCELQDTILIYNGSDQAFLSTVVEIGTGHWTAVPHNLAVSGDAWENVSSRWRNEHVKGYVAVEIAGRWYGPYAINYVVPDGLNVADSADVLPTAACTQVVLYNTTPAPTAAVPSKPLTVAAAAGTTLTGSYQYALTYQHGTYESNPSEWSDALTVAGADIVVAHADTDIFSSLDGVFEKINIYRRGGTLGDIATWVASIDDPRAKLGSGKPVAYIAGGGITRVQNTIPVGTGALAAWPTEGVVNINDGDEWVHYTSIDASKSILQGCTRAFAGTATAQPAGVVVVLCSYVDSIPDSGTVSKSLALDHGWITDPILTACKGDRLHLWFNTDHPDEDNMSSTLDWRYFNTQGDAAEVDFSNNDTGGIRRIGTDGKPVIQAKPGPNGTVIAFKECDVYAISGRAFWSIKVERVPDLDGTDAPLSVTAGDQRLLWLKGSRVWLWDFAQKMDVADPLRTTLARVSSAYESGAVGFFHDLKFYLFYPVDANGNKQYIEWDLRYVAPYESGKTGPSPITGDGVVVTCAAVSTLRNPEGIVYAGYGTDVWAILGTGATRYAYGHAATPAPQMELSLPDALVTDGTADALLCNLNVLTWAEEGAPEADLRVDYRTDSADTAHQAESLDAAETTGLQSVLKHLGMPKRGAYLGAKLSVPLASMATGSVCRALESVNIVVESPRQRGAK